MEIRQLRYFVAVAEHLNFTAAAEHLYIGQPSLSRQIYELEKELGVSLFIRDRRSVKLTSAGQFLLKQATILLDKIDDIAELTRQAGNGLIGSLDIGYMIENKAFTESFRRFYKKFPNIRITLNRIRWNDLNEALAHCNIDFAVTYCISLDSIPGIKWKTLYTEDLAVVVPENHPLADKEKIKLSLIKDETILMPSRSVSPLSYEHVEYLCIKNGFYPKFRSDNIWRDPIFIMVETGMGIAISPKNSFCVSPRLRFITIDDEDAKVDIAIAWNSSNSNPVIPLFLKEWEFYREDLI